ncbi:MAG: ion transporter [Elusimicrobia bacterium]|nr:ion transporter [Elusimicrobiota bacterium]
MKSVQEIVESTLFRRAVIAAILINAVHIGLETDPEMVRRYGTVLRHMDTIVMDVFCLEMLLRLRAASPTIAFFKDPWSWFDAAVIGAGFFPGSQFLTVFRLMRILRLMHTVRVMPGLKKISNAVFASIPSLGNVAVILFLLFYIYGTAGTLLYGAILPAKFGTLGRSLLTLFQMITLEGWSGVMYAIMPQSPYAWVFFVSFILFGTYFSLSSVVGILVGNLKLAEEPEDEELTQVLRARARIEARLEDLEK